MAISNISYAGMMHGDGFYMWSPVGTYTIPGQEFDYTSKSYYCKDTNMRTIYPKDYLDEHKATMQELGLSGTTPETERKEKAYKEGKCKLITGHKTLKKQTYSCVGLFSENEFLDIGGCVIHAEDYKKAKSQGKTDAQIDRVFRNSETKIKQEFKSGKGI